MHTYGTQIYVNAKHSYTKNIHKLKITNLKEFQIIFNDPSFSLLGIFPKEKNIDIGNIFVTKFFWFVKTERL